MNTSCFQQFVEQIPPVTKKYVERQHLWIPREYLRMTDTGDDLHT